jgi:hypothetical protein
MPAQGRLDSLMSSRQVMRCFEFCAVSLSGDLV